MHFMFQILIIRAVLIVGGILAGNAAFAAQAFDAQNEGKRLTTLAVQYEHGEGVTKDLTQAYALYCDAARIGYADAQYKLGWMIANGRGVPRDNALAAALFGMAADQGHAHAERMRNFVGKAASHLPACLVTAEPEPTLPPEPTQPTTIVVASQQDKDDLIRTQSVASVATIDWTRGQAERKRVVDIVHRLAPQYGIEPDFALSIITIESAFDPKARSPMDAHGLMQLIPATAERFGVKNIYDPHENVRGGLAYMRWLLAYFKGYVPWVAAAYNAGERNVENYKGVPPFNETRRYVERLCKLYPKNLHAYDASVVAASSQARGGLADSACAAGLIARNTPKPVPPAAVVTPTESRFIATSPVAPAP
jgi:TPR repeat protein